jgi:hypothetical protein
MVKSTHEIENSFYLICEECGNKLNADYDKKKETLMVRPCKSCIDKYIVESKVGGQYIPVCPTAGALKALLTAVNESYAALLRQPKQKKGE